MRFNGGLSNVTRHCVGEVLFTLICVVFVACVVLIVAFIAASFDHQSFAMASIKPTRRCRNYTLVSMRPTKLRQPARIRFVDRAPAGQAIGSTDTIVQSTRGHRHANMHMAGKTNPGDSHE
jgi:hypothetical protein